ncbi:hypothetical protein ACN6KF_001501 [Labrys sp. La1]|uniref:hypothetical protein n=1 Tax=Labrys sp. La1 TaxID=3404917 RepID=UPI003EBBE60C
MLVTETEAKARWCPHARQIHQGDIEMLPHNRSARGWETCVGSGCMAWRQGAPLRETLRNFHINPEVFPLPGYIRRYPDGWQYSHTDNDNGATFDLLHRLKPDAEPVGYCGLAGRVE